ncbi:spermidine/putrescine ABC transporter substrate-binding protein [Planctomycetota bacterium]|nr:spermidine/putrescine ABC transporter substrate-binding protein [Planctomycetota bacterium]
MRLIALLFAVLVAARAADPVNVYMYSEYIDPSIPGEFEKKTGIPVRISTYESQEEMVAKLMAGGSGQYDLLVASDVVVTQLVTLKLVAKLDQSKIPNAKNLWDRFRDPLYDKGNVYTLPYFWGPLGIIYRKDKLPAGKVVSWKLIFDESASIGPFVLMDEMRSMMGCAAIALGKDVNSKDKDEIKTIGQTVLKAKQRKDCLGFDGGVGGKNKVLAGQAALAVVYNGDAVKAMSESADVAFAVPVEGAPCAVDNLLVTSKAKNPAGAHAFIDFLMDAKIGARNADFTQYATPYQASLALVKAENRANAAIYPSDEAMKKLVSLLDLGSDTNRIYDEVWTAVKSR